MLPLHISRMLPPKILGCFLSRFPDASSQLFSPDASSHFCFSDASSYFFFLRCFLPFFLRCFLPFFSPMLPPKYFGRCFLPNRIMEIQIPRERSKILGLWSSIIAKRSTGNAWTKFWEPVQIFKRSRSSPSIVYRKVKSCRSQKRCWAKFKISRWVPWESLEKVKPRTRQEQDRDVNHRELDPGTFGPSGIFEIPRHDWMPDFWG